MKIQNYFKGIREGVSLLDKLKLSVIYVLDKFLKIRNKEINVVVQNDDGEFFCKTLHHVLMYSTNREKELRKYFKVKDKQTFIDVGANVGKYTIYIAKKYPSSRVIAIEPDKRSLAVMKENIKRNSLGNIKIIDEIVGDKVGEIEFYLNNDNPARNTIFLEEIEGQSNYNDLEDNKLIDLEKKIVKSTTIDQIVGNEETVGLMKIGVQGAELLVLKGAIKTIKRCHPTILFEAWSEKYLREIKKFLQTHSYKVDRIDKFNYIAKHK